MSTRQTHRSGEKLDSSTVVSLLGSPSGFGIPDATGGYAFVYNEGHLKRTVIHMLPFGGDPAARVFQVDVFPPSTERTKDGIGNGSTRGDALRKLGAPTRSVQLDNNSVLDIYVFDVMTFAIEYTDHKIYSITMTR